MDSLPPGAQVPRQNADDENKQAQEEQMRRDVMATVLDTAARERCVCLPFLHGAFNDTCFSLVSRIALVSPERAKQIEGVLLRMAQSGQLRGRVTEEQLIGFLDQVSPRYCSLFTHLFLRCALVGRLEHERRSQEVYDCGE